MREYLVSDGCPFIGKTLIESQKILLNPDNISEIRDTRKRTFRERYWDNATKTVKNRVFEFNRSKYVMNNGNEYWVIEDIQERIDD